MIESAWSTHLAQKGRQRMVIYEIAEILGRIDKKQSRWEFLAYYWKSLIWAHGPFLHRRSHILADIPTTCPWASGTQTHCWYIGYCSKGCISKFISHFGPTHPCTCCWYIGYLFQRGVINYTNIGVGTQLRLGHAQSKKRFFKLHLLNYLWGMMLPHLWVILLEYLEEKNSLKNWWFDSWAWL